MAVGAKGLNLHDISSKLKISATPIFETSSSNEDGSFPSSQKRRSTVIKQEMSELFDIRFLTEPSKQGDLRIQGIRDFNHHLSSTIEDEAKVVGHDHIIKPGLSQRYATEALTPLACQQKLEAFIGLNGRMPFRDQIERIAARKGESHIHVPDETASPLQFP